MWYNGLLDLSAWQLVGVTLLMTHVTIVSVTIYLHRYSAHRALELNGALKHFFRFWLWLTTAQQAHCTAQRRRTLPRRGTQPRNLARLRQELP